MVEFKEDFQRIEYGAGISVDRTTQDDVCSPIYLSQQAISHFYSENVDIHLEMVQVIFIIYIYTICEWIVSEKIKLSGMK